MKKWYLMDNYKPNITSGYESDSMSEWARDNFTDVLSTTFSDTVLLCNYDLSDCKQIKCVIQGNSADTHLKSMERIGLFPIGTVKAGMYIYFDDCYWIIDGYPSNNKSYEKATMKLCQYKLKWQNGKGDIIERWCNLTSASKYDDGEVSGVTLVLSSDNITVVMPDDDEVLYLGGKRVFIDKKPIPEKVYKLTRTDDVLYDYQGHGGIISFIADKKELDTQRDNQELGICDYISPTPDEPITPSGSITATIVGDNEIEVGFKSTYMATITDGNGNNIAWSGDYSWNVSCDYDVDMVIDGNKIKLLIEDEMALDESVKIEVLHNGTVIGTKIASVVSAI